MLLRAIEDHTWQQLHQHMKPEQHATKQLHPPKQRKKRQGPCHFGCASTCTTDGTGRPRWNGMPHYQDHVRDDRWRDVPAGATLCSRCYQAYTKAARKKKPRETVIPCAFLDPTTSAGPPSSTQTPCWSHARPPGHVAKHDDTNQDTNSPYSTTIIATEG